MPKSTIKKSSSKNKDLNQAIFKEYKKNIFFAIFMDDRFIYEKYKLIISICIYHL